MEGKPAKRKWNISFTSLVWIAILVFMAYRFIASSVPSVPEIPYSAFKTALNDGRITSVTINDIGISVGAHGCSIDHTLSERAEGDFH